MKKLIYLIFTFFSCAIVLLTSLYFVKPKTKGVIIAYVGGFRGLADIDSINTKRISHINYAFVDVKDNRAWLHNEATDTVNLRKLVELKSKNPELKILISIGGWTWSKNFSDAVLTDASTRAFALSAVDIVAKYKLDGVDIDWEYPGQVGDSNIFRPEDREHYTLLFKDLREGLDSLNKITNMRYFVTTAVGGSQDFIDHTEMDKVQQYTDYINVMAYDYAGEGDTVSNHHTNLFVSSNDTAQYSSHRSISNYIVAGVPPAKLVLGMGFYGKGWQLETADNNGLYRKVKKRVRAGGFDYLRDNMVDKNGFTRYWDTVAQAPYLFNHDSKVFITYDDEQSIKSKCDYVKKYKLGGAMFWEYEDDKNEYLLQVIAKEFDY